MVASLQSPFPFRQLDLSSSTSIGLNFRITIQSNHNRVLTLPNLAD